MYQPYQERKCIRDASMIQQMHHKSRTTEQPNNNNSNNNLIVFIEKVYQQFASSFYFNNSLSLELALSKNRKKNDKSGKRKIGSYIQIVFNNFHSEFVEFDFG